MTKWHKPVLSMLLWTWGGAVYFFAEVIWKTVRNNPEAISWTMFLVAIILCIPLERFGCELPWEMPLHAQAFICGTAITATELLAGLILNIWLKLNIWDYSNLPFNFLGQICLRFWILWIAVSAVSIIIFDFIRYAIEGGERPHYTI